MPKACRALEGFVGFLSGALLSICYTRFHRVLHSVARHFTRLTGCLEKEPLKEPLRVPVRALLRFPLRAPFRMPLRVTLDFTGAVGFYEGFGNVVGLVLEAFGEFG